MGMAPIDLDVGMLGPWGVALLGGVALSEWVWPCQSGCGLVGGSVWLWGWAYSNYAHCSTQSPSAALCYGPLWDGLMVAYLH